jgi:hypothetical protein
LNSQTLYEQRQSFFLAPSSTARGGLIFCILVGIVAFVGGMYSGADTRTWGAFLFNLFFFFTIAVGGSAFSGMQDIIGATWGRPIMRLHESFATFLPIGAVLMVVFFGCIHLNIWGAGKVYKWIAEPHMLDHFWGKRDWLKPGFMMARDIALLKGDKEKAHRLGAEALVKLRYWSAPMLVCYALTFSLLSFDLLMSLAPTWFSTLWGGWTFAIMMQTLMASTLLFMFAMRRTHLGQVIRRQQFHDVGKMMHGFTIFFAYLTFAHVLTYWYGNMPEETSYYIHRLQAPWLYLVIAAPFLVFVFPLFALLPKVSKWTSGLTVPIAAVILFSQWLVFLIVVTPEVTAADSFTFPWIEVGVFLGFLGLFLSAIFWFGRRFPMLSIADPLLAEALGGDHH